MSSPRCCSRSARRAAVGCKACKLPVASAGPPLFGAADVRTDPEGGVVIEAEHLCMSLHGVEKRGARTTTSALFGLVRDDARTRREFLSLVRG
ncbi:MAG TPA: GTP cyclohydrolase I [Solirubrobacteraceae bacterium]|nr:GTP cyclohydrolase I [Solirubrobacteraceae bacterium]